MTGLNTISILNSVFSFDHFIFCSHFSPVGGIYYYRRVVSGYTTDGLFFSHLVFMIDSLLDLQSEKYFRRLMKFIHYSIKYTQLRYYVFAHSHLGAGYINII